MKITLLQYYAFLSSGPVTLKLLNLKTLIIIELIFSTKWKEIIFMNKKYFKQRENPSSFEIVTLLLQSFLFSLLS